MQSLLAKIRTLKYFLTRKPLNIFNYFKNLMHCFEFFIFSPRMKTGTIEVSNICNLNCKMCETQESRREKGLVSWEVFTKAADDFYNAGVKNISFHTVNEPLLDKDIISKLKYLNQKGMKLLLTTNGTLVNFFLEKVKEAGLTNFTIRFSIDGATKETFENIRIGANFEKVVENLIKTFEYKQKYHKNLEISVNYCVNKETLFEIPLFIEKYSKYFDKMFFPLITGAFVHGANNTFYKENNLNSFTRQPCILPFRGLWVLYNGDVSICCADNNAELIVGNINKTSLIKIWHSDEIQKIRSSHLSMNVDLLPDKCKRCKMPNYLIDTKVQQIIDATVKANKNISKIPEKIMEIIHKYSHLKGYYDI